MDIASFRTSLDQPAPSNGLSFALQALWWDAKGDWTKAHEQAQAKEDAAGNWVHAYLHRKEGDLANAGYWYRRADRPVPQLSLDAEWVDIVENLIG